MSPPTAEDKQGARPPAVRRATRLTGMAATLVRGSGAEAGTLDSWKASPVPEQLVRVIDWVRGTFAGRCVGRFVEIQGLDRSVVLASQAFTALLPLLIVVVSLLPADKASVVADQIIDRFDLTGDVAATVAEVFTLPT